MSQVLIALSIFSYASSARAEPSSSAPPGAVTAPKLGGRLVLDTTSSAVIERREYFNTGVGYDSRWVEVCSAPCNVPADPEVDYRVGGQGIEPSRSFRVSPTGVTMVRADVALTGPKYGGIVMLGAGILAVNVGPVLMLAGVAKDLNEGDNKSDGSSLTRAGALVTLGGLAVGIAGLVLFLSNDKTTTQLSWSSQTAATKKPPVFGFTF
ncbi:MAG: hypothetical protein U0165_16970 [Polyangiaceae bacterium]